MIDGNGAGLPDTQVNHTEFEAAVRDFINTNVQLDDTARQEDLIQTLIWYYSPWPHIDDEEANNYQLIMVSQLPMQCAVDVNRSMSSIIDVWNMGKTFKTRTI